MQPLVVGCPQQGNVTPAPRRLVSEFLVGKKTNATDRGV
jgi:hypothetical protein